MTIYTDAPNDFVVNDIPFDQAQGNKELKEKYEDIDEMLDPNSIIYGPFSINLDNASPAELIEEDGTADKSKIAYVEFEFDEVGDLKPDFPVPEKYDGGNVIIRYAYFSAGAAKAHRLQLRTESIGSSDAFNPNLQAAVDITTGNQTSDANIGDILIASQTMSQANINWVAGETIQMRLQRDAASGDADKVRFAWIEFRWNIGR